MKKYFVVICAVLPLSLTACDNGVKDALGLNREAPDEFTVVSRPPLSLPPDFSLRPPQPGAAPLMTPADQQARELITGKDTSANMNPTVNAGASDNFLRRAGADQADSAIRDKLAKEAATPADTSNAKTLVDRLSGAKKLEPTVDPEKETERLKQNRTSGKPLNEGAVPEVQPKPESLIDRIF